MRYIDNTCIEKHENRRNCAISWLPFMKSFYKLKDRLLLAYVNVEHEY